LQNLEEAADMIVEVAGTIGVVADIDASSALSKYTINAGNDVNPGACRLSPEWRGSACLDRP
jgi:hypothetical protein